MRFLVFLLLSASLAFAQTTEAPKKAADGAKDQAAATAKSADKDQAAAKPADKAAMLQQAAAGQVPGALDEVVKPAEKSGIDAQKPGKVIVHEKGAAADALDGLVAKLNAYWQASYNRDYGKAYVLYMQAYRDRVPLKTFLSHRRGDVHQYKIESVAVWGDACAYVTMRLEMKTEFMDFSNFAVRQYWTLVDGEWFLYENPGSKALFQRSSQQVPNPCPLPEGLKPKPKKQAKKF